MRRTVTAFFVLSIFSRTPVHAYVTILFHFIGSIKPLRALVSDDSSSKTVFETSPKIASS